MYRLKTTAKIGGGNSITSYEDLNDKPQINGVELEGNKTSAELGLQPAGEYITAESDPTVPQHVKNITAENINSWNGKADASDIPDVSNFITKDVNNLTNYTLATNSGSSIELNIDSSTYVATLNLKNAAGTVISTGSIDLPLESVVVNGSYDNVNKKVILTLQNGSTIEFSVADLVNGLQSEITSTNKLDASLVDDSLSTNKFVTTAEKTTWNNKLDSTVINITYKSTNATTLAAINEWLSLCDFENKRLAPIYAYNDNQNMRWELNGLTNYNITSDTRGMMLYFKCYTLGSTNDMGRLYTIALSLTLSNGTATSLSWSNESSGIVLLNTSMAQTIAGIKTFNNLPISSATPTQNNQFVNKKYVDDSIASAITDALSGSY